MRGYRSLLDASVARQLRLTDAQTGQIEATFKTLQDEISELQERAAKGESRDRLNQQASESQDRAQKKFLAILSADQKRQFVALAGRSFDLAKLGQVRFHAPELPSTKAWINAPPIRLADLRSKVIALHFWAYG